MTNANAPNVENVEMTNAFVNNARNANNLARNEAVRRSRAEAVLAKDELKAKRAKEAANKANANARQAAVNRSKAEAVAARAAARAKREESSPNNTATRKANANAKKAAENAKKATENAKKATENAKKAAENAENAEKVKKAAAANALLQNIKEKWSNIRTSTMSRNEKKKKGTTIFRKASLKLHPNKPSGNAVSFRLLITRFDEFKTYVNRN